MSDYTNEEIRMKVIPLAVQLINVESQRLLGRCNTTSIAEITQELLNIVKYGTPVEPSKEAVTDVIIDQPKADNSVKFA